MTSSNIFPYSPQEQAMVRHHFVQFLDLGEYYSASQFEADVMRLLPQLWQQADYAVMCGGSMLYVDAVCKGIDLMPTISAEVREKVQRQYNECGIECIIAQLELLDSDYLAIVDKKNEKRLLHALEICLQSGKPYSELRTGQVKPRPFEMVKIGLNMQNCAIKIMQIISMKKWNLIFLRCAIWV